MLNTINESGGAQIRDLQACLDLPKPTIIRMVATLFADGYIKRDDAGTYKVTAKVLSLANGYDSDQELLDAAKPVLLELRRENTWPSDLAIFDNDAMSIVDMGNVPGTFSINRRRGSRLPVLTTALGRAYLAFCPANQREEIFDRLIRTETSAGKPLDPERISAILKTTQESGYALGDAEYLRNTRAVAVPIMVNGQPQAAINMMVHTSAMDIEQAENTFVAPLKVVARKIQNHLEHTSSPNKSGSL